MVVQWLRFWFNDWKVGGLDCQTATVGPLIKALKPPCSRGAISWLTCALSQLSKKLEYAKKKNHCAASSPAFTSIKFHAHFCSAYFFTLDYTHLGYSLVWYLYNLRVNLKQQTRIVQLPETNFSVLGIRACQYALRIPGML